MELQNSITRANIKNLVNVFYAKAIRDKEIGAFFVNALGEDMTNEAWSKHIELLTDFWSTMLVVQRSYIRDPFAPHALIPDLKRESFIRWMELFSASADEVYVSGIATRFKKKAELFSKRFMRNLMI